MFSDADLADMRRLVEISHDLFCLASYDGYFLVLNPAWERTLGWTLHELKARPYLSFVHPDDLDRTEAEAAMLAAGGSTVWFENRYRCRDGSYRWLLWSVASWPARQRLYAVARDITPWKDSEEALRRAKETAEAATRELEAFSYAVSHDLRAPLRAIDGLSQVLVEDFGEGLPEEARSHLARVRVGAQRMAHLIDDLLLLSRISRTDLVRERVDALEVARDVLAGLRERDPGRVVEAVMEGSLPVRADPHLLRIALENLISNAWKFTARRPRARIEFGVESRDGEPVLFVRDDGAGFEPRYAGNLFRPFKRLHRESEFPGTGIGLATVKRVVQRHGGRIWAEGEPGEGATFYFTLPAQL